MHFSADAFSQIMTVASPLGWSFNPLIDPREVIEKNQQDTIYLDKKGELKYHYSALKLPGPEDMQVITDVIELFKEIAREEIPILQSNSIEEKVSKILKDYISRHRLEYPEEESENLLKISAATVGGNLGPLEFLVSNDSFEEIIFNGIGENIYVKHKDYGRMKTNFFFTDIEYVKENIINKIAEFVGEPNISENNPILPATLPNGDRLHALMYPIVDTVSFTIRHFPKNPISLPDLLNTGTLNPESAVYLWLVLELGRTIFFIGATGTGKTTLLNCLLPLVPPDRRILSLEEVREIRAPHRDFLYHQTRRSQGIRMNDLIESSLRETPDRVVIGEVRTSEDIKAFLELAQAGPGEGSYATFHGETLETAIKRLKHHGISAVDLSGAVHLLILLKRRREYDRKLRKNIDVRYVSEVAELGNDAELNKVFTYNHKTSGLERTKSPSLILNEYKKVYNLTQKQLDMGQKERASFLGNSPNLDYNSFSEKIRNFYRKVK